MRVLTVMALGLSCSVFTIPEVLAQDDGYTPGMFIGVKGLYLKPFFEFDVVGADEDFGPSDQLKIFSFDWKHDGAYRAWIGRDYSSGFGWSLGHQALNQSTDFVYTVPVGGRFRSDFDPDHNGADILVDGTLNAENQLRLSATDLEFWQTAMLPNMKLRYGAGVRYATLDRSFFAYETGGPEFARFDHDFRGAGPTLNYEVEVPVANGFSLYNFGRVGLLFGKHRSSYSGEGGANNSGTQDNFAMLPTYDAEIGIQWRGHLGSLPGEVTLRAGMEAQAWINGGGWDLYHPDSGARFPQQAGSFGFQGFSLSAQYKFGAEGAGATSAYTASWDEGPQIVAGGFFVGGKALYLTPYFENDILGGDSTSGVNNGLEVLSFDWDGSGAYKVWGGYETPTGLGVSVSHMGLNQSTNFSRAENGGTLAVYFDPDTNRINSLIDGTLIATNSLKLDATDVEFWQKTQLPNMTLRYGAGVRYATIDRAYYSYETGGTEAAFFNHEFSGWGPTLNYEVEIPLAKQGFSFYNSARASILFGKHDSNYHDENNTGGAGSSESYSLLPTFDAEIGLQWRGQTGSLPGELTIRAGLEAQAWINGGGWDLYKNIAGALFPQQLGSFGLQGFNLSANYSFGDPSSAIGYSNDDNQDPLTEAGFIIGVKALHLTPFFENDVAAADEGFGPNNTLEVFSFDWDGDGAYKAWLGYETRAGLRATVSHMRLDQSTRFAVTSLPGSIIQAHFDLGVDDADIFVGVGETLNAKNSLKINATDFDISQKAMFENFSMRYGAGVRFASIERNYFASESIGNEFINFDHSFSGFGPSLNYEFEVPVANGFSVYNSGRAALLFGEHRSDYEAENTNSDNGRHTSRAMLPTLDAEIGVQWQGKIGGSESELTIRAGLEAQAWVNGGGWQMYRDAGGSQFPQQSGSFGLSGFSLSAQYKF